MRLALGLEYSGSEFCGWQTQPHGCGVQDALEAALSEIAAEKIATICAGRTDAGVHALGQVVHFDTSAVRPLSAWIRGVNALLPPGVCVLWAHEVDGAFHARYSASARRYQYVLLNRPQRPGLLRSLVGWFHLPLDTEAMHAAARALLGEHNFSAFRTAECLAKNPTREITDISVTRSGDLVVFDMTANAFLHHMVRNIVGSLVYVGCGRQPEQWIAQLLETRERKHAAPTFSPDGLYLCEVEYPSRFGLPCRKRHALVTTLRMLAG